MPPSPKNPTWLVVPPLVAFFSDVIMTLTGQPATYWSGTREHVEELNPVGRWLLLIGPWHFLTAAITWAVCFALILRFWPSRLVVPMSFILSFGHAIGSASWLPRHGFAGIVGAVVWIFLIERLWNHCERKANPAIAAA